MKRLREQEDSACMVRAGACMRLLLCRCNGKTLVFESNTVGPASICIN